MSRCIQLPSMVVRLWSEDFRRLHQWSLSGNRVQQVHPLTIGNLARSDSVPIIDGNGHCPDRSGLRENNFPYYCSKPAAPAERPTVRNRCRCAQSGVHRLGRIGSRLASVKQSVDRHRRRNRRPTRNRSNRIPGLLIRTRGKVEKGQNEGCESD